MNYISSIVNPAPGKFMVAKSPIEDFNNGTILTVNPGEKAIFLNQGEIVQIFNNGRFELTTNNFPFLNMFRRFLANGELTYRCSIFFITETQSAEVLWGFPLQVRDPVQNIFTKVFVRGSYTVRVNDGGKLLLTLLGMNVNFMAAPDVKAFFGNRFQQHISNLLARFISNSNREILDLCTDNMGVAELIAPNLSKIVEDSGLEVSNFCISAMQVDENDPNRRFLESAYAKRREMEIMGSQYATIKETDIRTNVSRGPFVNYPGTPTQQTGGMVNVGVPGMSGVGVMQPVDSGNHQQYPQQKGIGNGQQTSNSTIDYHQKLKQLHSMKEDGLISEEEYSATKAEILKNMI